ncbi:hypothetical protein AQ490_12455 [Wenjunlia vitaminophila]|uniref:Polysaccharide biosynthesis protein n=1 Tax=Wenjunlia vitaminophila TaxID=76728 RepID=A0A0T6LLF1_WENVI|nr:hypothetical protein AQ490_12455 [Wenjunlia vitaminophila]
MRGGWFGFLGSAVTAVFGFLLVTVVTRAAGAAQAGAVFTGVAAFTVATHASKLGADTGLVRFVSRDLATTGGAGVPALLRTAVLPGAALSTVGAVVLLAAPDLATGLLPELSPGQARSVVRMFAVCWPVTTVSLVLLGATRGHGTVLPFVGVEQVGKPVLRVLLALPVAVLAPGVLGLSAAWLLPSLLGAVAAALAVRRLTRALGPGPATPPGQSRAFWAFSGPRAVSSVCDIAAVWIGVLVLSAVSGSAEAGIYTAIGRLVTAGTLLQLAVRLAVAPQISRTMAGGDLAGAEHLHRLSTRWIVLFSWPLFVLLAAFPGTALGIFGAGFASGATALAVLSVACAVNVAVGNAQTVILMAGRSTWNLAVAGAASVVQVGCAVVLVPRHGVLGAALAFAAAMVLDNVASALLVRRRLRFTTVDRGYAAAAGVGLCGVAAVALPTRLLAGDGPAGLVAAAVLACGAVAVGTWRYREALGAAEFLGALRQRPARELP